jgi:succinate dehydrogenase/fumarate reductase-like Fe-S protein
MLLPQALGDRQRQEDAMSVRTINVRVFRFNPIDDKEPYYVTYQVPIEKGMSAMTVLDYIYENLDGTLAYYDHAACDLGICARCTGVINGRPGLFCQTRIQGDVTLEPSSRTQVLKDLVVKATSRCP